MASKKGAPHIKTTPYEHVRRLPGRPPRVRTSQTRNKSSSTSSRNCCSNSFFWLFFENVVSIRFHFRFVENQFEKIWKKCQEHIVDDLTRPRPRPGEVFYEIHELCQKNMKYYKNLLKSVFFSVFIDFCVFFYYFMWFAWNFICFVCFFMFWLILAVNCRICCFIVVFAWQSVIWSILFMFLMFSSMAQAGQD